MFGQPQIVIAREIDHLAAADRGGGRRRPFHHLEVRIRQPQVAQLVGNLADLPILGQRRETEHLLRDFARRDGAQFVGRQVNLDAVGHLGDGPHRGKDVVREACPVMIFDRRDNLHPFQRIEIEFEDIGVELDLPGPVFGNLADLVHHHLHGALPHHGVGNGQPFGVGPGRFELGTAQFDALDLLRDLHFVPGDPPFEHRQRVVQEVLAAGMPLDLAARGLGDRAAANQRHPIDRHLVFDGHLAANGGDDLGQLFAFGPRGLRDDDQPFAPRHFGHHGGGRHPFQQIVALLNRLLDILRVAIHPADDEHVLQAAGDEQLAVVQEAEVAGPQERPFLGIGNVGVKDRLGRFRVAPISLRDARAADPHLAHFVRGTFLEGVGVDDQNFLVRQCIATTDQHPRAVVVRVGLDHLMSVERIPIDGMNDRRILLHPARDNQRRFGHPVARVKCLAAESARFECLGEPFEGLGPYRLGAVESEFPTAQVELLALLGRDLLHAQLVGEIGPSAHRALVFRDRPEPAEWLLQEGHRRHQHVWLADLHRLQHPADQPHVVVHRQPETGPHAPRMFECVRNERRVVDHVPVREHHPLGRSGRARGVLQKGERVGADFGVLPHFGLGQFYPVDVDPVDRLQPGRLFEHRLHPLVDVRDGQGDLGLGVVRNRLNADHIPVASRRISRHRHHPGIQTAKKRSDEI